MRDRGRVAVAAAPLQPLATAAVPRHRSAAPFEPGSCCEAAVSGLPLACGACTWLPAAILLGPGLGLQQRLAIPCAGSTAPPAA